MNRIRKTRTLLKGMPNTSFPRNKIRVLLVEDIHPDGLNKFLQQGYQVEALPGAPKEDELCERIETVHLLGIRSTTKITANVLARARRLWAIGCFCIGTNQVDLIKARQQGVAVFNAPYSNTRSVAELVIGEIIMLLRRVFEKSQAAHNKIWDKSSAGSFEVRGKTLGIIGYGHIGSQVSILAEALGMNVIYYDLAEKLPIGNATAMPSLAELLRRADIVTLHVPEDEGTINLMAAPQFAEMKKGSYFLNLSRGRNVELQDLRQAILDGHIAGAAIDVFPTEPKSNQEAFTTELQSLPNVILTPHIGGSTLESQKDIAAKTGEKLINYMNTGTTIGSVNFPEVQLPILRNRHRILHIHKNVPGVISEFSQTFARLGINIESQVLKTEEDLGYLVTDVNRLVDRRIVEDLKKLEATIKVRVLF
ncbi:MAG: phosphoglycerate dehydrogenase [bacterium]